MVDWQVGDGLRRRQPDIDGDACATGGAGAQAAPGQHAGAGRAEQDFERRRILSGARITARWSRNADAFVDIIIGPERALAPAERAVAGCHRAGIALQGLVGCATVAGSRQHSFSPGVRR